MVSRSTRIIIRWADRRLEEDCTTERKGRKRFGAAQFALLQKRLASLDNARCLEVMRNLPGRCHELTADLDGDFAILLWGPYRLLFRPDHDPLPLRDPEAGGGLDWNAITRIVILEVADYHGR